MSTVDVLFGLGARGEAGVDGLQGSASPFTKASRSYAMPKPPYWFTASVFGGAVILKASLQMMLSYSSVNVREISGSWPAGTPDPVCKKPHCVQY
jgi:hypothetical protein